MLSPAETEVLRELKRVLEARFGDRLRAVSLFGSRARGAGRDDSDLDVLVDVRDVTRTERGEILDLAADLGVDSGLLLSPLVVSGPENLPAGMLSPSVGCHASEVARREAGRQVNGFHSILNL